MKPVTVALIGGGHAGNFHSSAYRQVSSVPVRLKTVVDIDLFRAETIRDRWGYEQAAGDYDAVLRDPEIDAVDIVLPPALHADYSIRAVRSGKHVICEKPLTGYFGQPGDPEPIGDAVPKSRMYTELSSQVERMRGEIKASGRIFCFAENYVYAPAVVKAAELLRAKKSRIVYQLAECSVHGSTSPFSSYWNKVGGGSMNRLGSHSIGGVLYLKRVETGARGAPFGVESVLADTGRIAPALTDAERTHLKARPADVEDFATLTITFTDGTKAIVIANDNTMGGIRNTIRLCLNDGVLNCNMTPADNMTAYYIDQAGLEGCYISEQLDAKTGWNSVLIAEEHLRGYTGELDAFMGCIAAGRQPESGIDLACDTIRLIYAAYVSAEEGRRVFLNE